MDLERLTKGWSFLVWKTLLMGSLGKVIALSAGRLREDSVRGLKELASYRQVALCSNLGHGRLRLQLSFLIARLRRVIGGSLHCFFQVDVGLSSWQNLSHLGNIVLKEMLRNLHPVDEHECIDVLIAVEDLGELALEEIDIWFETITLSHLHGKKVMAVLLDLPARGILSEERFNYLFELVKKAG